jgi:hypothetical protein
LEELELFKEKRKKCKPKHWAEQALLAQAEPK